VTRRASRASGPRPVTSRSQLPGPTGHHDMTDLAALRAGNAAPARLLHGCRTPGPRFSCRGAAFHSVPSAVFIQSGARWDSHHASAPLTARCLQLFEYSPDDWVTS